MIKETAEIKAYPDGGWVETPLCNPELFFVLPDSATVIFGGHYIYKNSKTNRFNIAPLIYDSAAVTDTPS